MNSNTVVLEYSSLEHSSETTDWRTKHWRTGVLVLLQVWYYTLTRDYKYRVGRLLEVSGTTYCSIAYLSIYIVTIVVTAKRFRHPF
jgi:hypothetical protein